jgi:hypothetical protein
MDVMLSSEESAAVSKALRSYLSDLRMEISNTDNAEYKRMLREEREALEAAVRRLDEAAHAGGNGSGTVTVVEIWWSPLG